MTGDNRPYVLISSAVSLDGCLDDCSGERLVLSTDEDLERIDALRAEYDAIMVGAGTLRADNPRLMLRSPVRRAARRAAGRSEEPLKVTFTLTGNLPPELLFFADGNERLIYCPERPAEQLRGALAGRATIVPCPQPSVDLRWLLTDLAARGVERLLVEGGEATNTTFITAGLFDEIRLAIAPFFVGEAGAHRFVGASAFPFTNKRRLRLERVEQLGDMAVMWYCIPRGEL